MTGEESPLTLQAPSSFFLSEHRMFEVSEPPVPRLSTADKPPDEAQMSPSGCVLLWLSLESKDSWHRTCLSLPSLSKEPETWANINKISPKFHQDYSVPLKINAFKI